ncbi:MAG: AAA family ATPase, partial [Myxococcota bacterium]
VEGFGDNDRRKWRRILEHQTQEGDWEDCLVLLCKLLTLHHKRSPWLLLDEYDRPIHEAYIRSKQQGEDIGRAGSYFDEMASFMSIFLGEALKGNDFLFRSVITGILRVAKEDIFSSVNNLGVYGVLDDRFARRFGFTQAEVDELLRERDLIHRSELVRAWYDGYCFGQEQPARVYNPWSVISYVGTPANIPQEYWVNSGGVDILQSLGHKKTEQSWRTIEVLLSGGTVRQDVSDNMPLRDLGSFSEVFYSLLLTSGYVTASDLSRGVMGKTATLRIPNEEVCTAFRRLAKSWLRDTPSNELLAALREGRPEEFARRLDVFARASLSYFDIQPSEPEWVYHMLLLGILSHVVDEYRVRS